MYKYRTTYYILGYILIFSACQPCPREDSPALISQSEIYSRQYDTVEIDNFLNDEKKSVHNHKKVQHFLQYIMALFQAKNIFDESNEPVHSDDRSIISNQTHMSLYSLSFSNSKSKVNESHAIYYTIDETFINNKEKGQTNYIISGDSDKDYILTTEHIRQFKKIAGYKFRDLVTH